VMQNGMALQYADKSLINQRHIVLEAVSQNCKVNLSVYVFVSSLSRSLSLARASSVVLRMYVRGWPKPLTKDTGPSA
jgi:hypothetical protein